MKTITDPYEFLKRDLEFRRFWLKVENVLIIVKNRQNKIKKELPVVKDERSYIL